MNLRSICHLISILIALLGAASFLCAPVGYFMGDSRTILQTLAAVSGLLILLGLCGAWFTRSDASLKTGMREGFAVVAFGWLSAVLVGAAPFFFVTEMTLPDAIFESASGFSTTGASIIDSTMKLRTGATLPNGVESLPYCILFWRALTNWLGGMGIVLFALVILPFLGVSGQQLYNAEVPGLKTDSDQFTPRLASSAKIIWMVYAVITVTEAVLLFFGGMHPFDAICHSFSTIATGGFSTKNASIAYYSSPYLQWVITIFMLLASCNFAYHYRAIFTGKWKIHLQDEEFRVFTALVACAVLLIGLQLYFSNPQTILSGIGEKEPTTVESSLRYAAFQVATVISSTGFSTANFAGWPTLSMMILFVLMFIGGCAGSTAGGMKCVRALIFFKHAKSEVTKCIFPRALRDIRLNGNRLETDTLSKITAFMLSYLFLFGIIALLLAMVCEMDLITAFSASVASLSNIGPGFGQVGPSCTYAWMNTPAKLLLSFAMILGRLELYAILVIFLPAFWKK